MYTVWTINDFESFSNDPQYNGFTNICGLKFEEAMMLIKICAERGIVTILEPEKE